jgi:3-methyladenine DNA glycosylase AlkD
MLRLSIRGRPDDQRFGALGGLEPFSDVRRRTLLAVLDAAKHARRIEVALRRSGSPERAEGEKAYLKSDLRFFGATLAEIRRAAKEAGLDRKLDRDGLLELVEELWRVPVFERRMVAALILDLRADDLRTEDMALIERLIRESRTWALVDVLAGDVVGEMAMRLRIRRTLDRWARDDDFWVRRASLLAELEPLKHGAPFEPFARRADRMLEEREFFIRKAIGWVLRETSKRRPEEVYAWIAPRTHRASGVTVREAVKYLDAGRADRLMAAYAAGRPAVRPATG